MKSREPLFDSIKFASASTYEGEIPLVPIYRGQALPRGIPIFLNQDEFENIKKNEVAHKNDWQKHYMKLLQRDCKEEDELKAKINIKKLAEAQKDVKPPEPAKHHTHCAICHSDFEDYFQHLDGQSHKLNVNLG